MQQHDNVCDEKQEDSYIKTYLIPEFCPCHLFDNHIGLVHLHINFLVLIINALYDVALSIQILVGVFHDNVSVNCIFLDVLYHIILIVLSVYIVQVLVAGVLLHFILHTLNQLKQKLTPGVAPNARSSYCF